MKSYVTGRFILMIFSVGKPWAVMLLRGPVRVYRDLICVVSGDQIVGVGHSSCDAMSLLVLNVIYRYLW